MWFPDETDTSPSPSRAIVLLDEAGFRLPGGELGGNGPFLIILMSLFHMHSYFEALSRGCAHFFVFFFRSYDYKQKNLWNSTVASFN